ncbi:petal death protein [Carex littledalei]|uniref:Petal death protein n=1 Tax=Carex littledalei TaxID=544730 RepID=A0A833RJ50_9POAL|nr:petal death protein [Carex littledalei]
MACSCCNLKTTFIPPRHQPFSSHQPPPNLQNQLHFFPNLSTTNLRSQLINTTVPRSSYYTPPITTSDSPAKALRQLLESSGIHQGPACFDALSAKLIERAGFRFCFTSGFSISAARLGLPDVGLISYGEMIDQGSLITQAVSIPVIGDGDNGYGNAMNVKRTVKGFIKAGFAGILLEDQVAPKACGHTQGRKVVSREEAVMKIKAAIDARKESGSDIVIVARSDSRQAVSLEEALWRSRAFADAGADVLFIDALASREEMKAFCEANMLEGGGKTPILTPVELEELGFKLISYPLSLIGVSMRAMEDGLTAIKSGRVPPPGSLPSFDEIKETLGFNNYYEEEKRYMVNNSQPSYGTGYSTPTYGERISQGGSDPIIDLLPPVVYDNLNTNSSRDRMSWIWSRTLRLKITGKDGLQKLDVRIPVSSLLFMCMILGLAGVNIMEMLEDAPMDADGSPQSGKVLLDFNDAAGDRIQVLVE